jgi:radical SAM superfamily enzyme YgiQ (UPF0313 family)
MKILLINPPRHHELIGKNPHIVEKHRGYNPPLGILFLANYIKKNSSHEVELMDCQPQEWSYEELQKVLDQKNADVVGITAMTFTLIDVQKTIRAVKKAMPKCKLLLGGSHIHIYPKEALNMEGVDYIFQGEGEISFVKFLEVFGDEEKLKQVPGIAFYDKAGNYINNNIAPNTTDLDSLGYPDRRMLDVNQYTSLLGKTNRITTMFTSRGCPFRCTFCDRPYSPVISGFRWRSARHVADEMEDCLSLGIHEAFIYDDTFTVRKDRVFELCDEIKSRGLDFRWDIRAHVNTITPELLKAMKSAGCDRIHFGVECGNDRMMKVIRKNTNVEKVTKTLNWAKAAGIEVLAYFIFGQQTETTKDIEDTMNLAVALNPNYAHFTVFCPYPATEIYQKGLESGIIKEDVWKSFAENPRPGFELPVWEENFTRRELQELLVRAYRKFYLRPRYIARNIGRIRSWGEFKRKAKAGLSVFTMKPTQTPGKISSKAADAVPGAAYDVSS